MIPQKVGFVKSFQARDMMLQINDGRAAHPGDLIITECPNAILLRLPGSDAGSPRAAGYAQRRIKVGCRNCEVCTLERLRGRVTTWSQKLKAFLTHESEVKKSTVKFLSLTFPPHPDGDELRDGAPTKEMVQTAWDLFLTRFRRFYRSRGIDPSEAVNYIGVLERGGRNGRFHMHMLHCERPGFPHPTDEKRVMVLRYERVHRSDLPMASTREYYAPDGLLSPMRDDPDGFVLVPHYGDGLCKIWSDVMEYYGYERLQHFYAAPMRSASQLAGYCSGKYLLKGIADEYELGRDKIGRTIRPAQQREKTWDELMEWYRDKRYGLKGRQYRRWVGFKVQLKTIDADGIGELAELYVDAYRKQYQHVSFAGERVRESNLPVDSFRSELLRRLSDLGNRGGDNRRLLGDEGVGIPVSVSLHPVLIALADREVSHPASADYLSCAQFYAESDRFGLPFRISKPQEVLDSRFNLCEASHWWPLDDGNLDIRKTEAYAELQGWHESLRHKIDDAVIKALDFCFPGQPYTFLTQGMTAPYDLLNESAVRSVLAGFPGVFPDVKVDDGRVEASPVRTELSIRPPAPDAEIAESLHACRDWTELTDIPMDATDVPGIWPKSPIKVGQMQIIDRINAGESGLYCLPTGYGKSYCFQASHVLGGLTLVISPLTALIRDQVQALRRKNVRAESLAGSECSREEVKEARMLPFIEDTESPGIIYCAPESLSLQLLKNGKHRYLPRQLINGDIRVTHLVIDEVHCISQWAEFRPNYLQIPEMVAAWAYQPEVVSGFSATISPRVLADVRKGLSGLGVPLPFFGTPMARPNLHIRRSAHIEFTDFFAAEWQDVKLPCLIFAGQKKNAERLHRFLYEHGLRSALYHAGIGSRERREVEGQFRRGEVDILCGTIAYGMGVDKADIRTVIHDTFPQSVENYVQEIGRAGRDGEPSECILLQSPGMVEYYAEALQDFDAAQKAHEESDISRLFHTPHCVWHHIALEHGQPGFNFGTCDGCLGLSPFHGGTS